MTEPDQLSRFGALRRLRFALRLARERVGRTQEDVAAALDWSVSKLMRIESGAVGIAHTDLLALCRLYEMGPAVVDQLQHYRRATRKRPWWYEFKADLPASLTSLIDLESEATTIRILNSFVVPGLLQTREYARVATELSRDEADDRPDIQQRIDSQIAVRLRRQQLLERGDPPQLEVVLDEAVLYRAVGGAAVMSEQVLWLAELSRRPGVDLRVLPFEAGRVVSTGIFTLLHLPDGDELLYQPETTPVDQPGLVSTYRSVFQGIWELALDHTRTNYLLHWVATQYASGGHARPWL